MTNIKLIRLLFALGTMALISLSHAAELELFDNGKLVVLDMRGVLRGYYSGSSNSNYLSGDHRATVTCEFLFRQAERGDGVVHLQAWEPALVIPDEGRQTSGALYDTDGQIVLNFEHVPNGCRSKQDGDALLIQPAGPATGGEAIEEQGLHTRRTGKERVIGIRLVPSGGIVHSESGVNVVVPKWALVVLVRQQVGNNYVRYVDPASGRAVEGWLSKELKDPFMKPY